LEGSLIEVYETCKEIDNSDAKKFLKSTNASARGHPLKLIQHGCKLGCRKFSLPGRIVNA
jgi:hypothetical protein